jgi:hypothetical protein
MDTEGGARAPSHGRSHRFDPCHAHQPPASIARAACQKICQKAGACAASRGDKLGFRGVLVDSVDTLIRPLGAAGTRGSTSRRSCPAGDRRLPLPCGPSTDQRPRRSAQVPSVRGRSRAPGPPPSRPNRIGRPGTARLIKLGDAISCSAKCRQPGGIHAAGAKVAGGSGCSRDRNP